jgi:hypothetical protein
MSLIFKPELAEAVLEGRKTVTRRLVRTDNPRSPWSPERAPQLVGRRRAVVPGRGKHGIGFVTVRNVRRERNFDPLNLTSTGARLEGFASPEDMLAAWASLGNPVPADVWRVEFEVVS